MNLSLPVGKLPPDLLATLIQQLPTSGEGVLLGPGVGLDCAILDFGDQLLALKSEPITFATDEIGWYSVQIAANDIATTGAEPRWLLATLLLPEGKTNPDLVKKITAQLAAACREIGVVVIGGHTEITHGLDRPMMNTTMIGVVARERLITPRGAQPGDDILITKGVPVEAAAILAREFPERLAARFTQEEIRQAQQYLYQPGISVLPDVRAALQSGRVTAMHDPTEGGILNALWELSAASGASLNVDLKQVEVLPLADEICRFFDIDPLASISSGALLLTCPPDDSAAIQAGLRSAGITSSRIGKVASGPQGVWQTEGVNLAPIIQPVRDEIARVFDRES